MTKQTKHEAPETDRQFIKSSEKMFEVLEFFASHGREQELSLTRVVEELGYAKTTAHRLMYSLQKLGYLEEGVSAGTSHLGPRFFHLVEQRISHYRLKMVARPIMRDLSTKVQETVNLGILDHDEILLLDVVDGPNALRWVSEPGERSLLHATALGKAIAAFLPTEELDSALKHKGLSSITRHTQTKRSELMCQLASIRQDFLALDDEESVEGVQCVASPVFDASMRVVAAISVSAPKTRFSTQIAKARASVLHAARTLSKSLGYQVETQSIV